MNSTPSISRTPSCPGIRAGWLPLLSCLIGLSGAPVAHAAIRTTLHFRMGESALGLPGTAIVSSIEALNAPVRLTAVGNASYDSSVAESAEARTGSALALRFDGASQHAWIDRALSTAVDNFGLELWVRPESLPEGFALVAYNGDTRSNGWGFYQYGAMFGIAFGGGVGLVGNAPATVGTWVHLAMVRDRGVTTFYVDGVAGESSNVVPETPAGGFAIASHPQDPAGEFFNGAIDEVRLFTFDAGQFSVDDLLLKRRVATEWVPFPGSETRIGGIAAGSELDRLCWFEWGTTLSYGNRTFVQHLTHQPTDVRFGDVLHTLTVGTLYHYRAVASNSAGLFYGLDVPFQVNRTVVRTFEDGGPGSLREALSNAVDGGTVVIPFAGTIVLRSGGLILDKSVTILGTEGQPIRISGGGTARPFTIRSGATVSFSDITIGDGFAGDGLPGGGIYNGGTLTLTRCRVTGCRAGRGADTASAAASGLLATDGGHGGGIYSEGPLTMSDCSIDNNAAGDGGAGVTQFAIPGSPGRGGNGGGIFSSSSLFINRCTLAGNTAGAGGQGGNALSIQGLNMPAQAGGAGGSGGGLWFAGQGRARIELSTLSGNACGAGGVGGSGGPAVPAGHTGEGGAIAQVVGSVTLISSTVANNRSTEGCGGVFSTTSIELTSTLLAGNQGSAENPDVLGPVISHGNNLVGIYGAQTDLTNGQLNDQIGSSGTPIAPRLGPLRNNGGITRTHALLPGSPALDAGADTGLGSDQRGRTRVFGKGPDIGAFEQDGSIIPDLSAETTQAEVVASASATGVQELLLIGIVNPGGFDSTVWFEFGLTTAYSQRIELGEVGSSILPSRLAGYVGNCVPGFTYHYRIVATNVSGMAAGMDKLFTVPTPLLAGDTNGDGVVSEEELRAVLANYWPHSPWLQMTNLAGLGSTNVTFEAPNATAGAFTVESSDNLSDWAAIGLAIPSYRFLDTNAPAFSSRYYRLRSP